MSAPLPPNIIALSDGTGNSSAALFRTSIWKIYKALDLEDRQNPPEPRQFACYNNGVGTSAFKPLQLLGSVFGVGLARNVRTLYAFICRTYVPGAQIYLFGFSRGAFTVRILAGLIATQGLVPYDGDEAALKRNVAAAYRAYRGERFIETGGLVPVLRWVRDQVVRARNALFGWIDYDTFKDANAKPDIRFVGVFDTVAAYGLPIDELAAGIDQWLWPLSMPDYDLGEKVGRAMHALALDDERNTFHPQLWNELDLGLQRGPYLPNRGVSAKHVDQERLSQVWFAGAHSDVGGGYPDDGVSFAPLDWIKKGAEAAGPKAGEEPLRFIKTVWEDYEELGDENGPVHDPRSGIGGGFYRYNPRRIARLIDPALNASGKVKIDRVKIHESALRRIRAGQDGYAPIILPPDFDVVTIDDDIVPAKTYFANVAAGDAFDPQSYAAQVEHIFNLVWWRRVVYFATLAAALSLLALPFLPLAANHRPCVEGDCLSAAVFSGVGTFLPGFAATWLDAFASNVGLFLKLFGLAVVGTIIGSFLQRRISDAMRAVWREFDATRPASVAGGRSPTATGFFGGALQWFRTSRGYERTMHVLKHAVFPFLFALLVTILVGALVYGGARKLFEPGYAILPHRCDASERSREIGAEGVSIDFRTKAPCTATGLKLAQGERYRLSFAVPAGETWDWKDASIPAGPNGNAPDRTPWELKIAAPIRRYSDEPWFKLMAQIGPGAADIYPLGAAVDDRALPPGTLGSTRPAPKNPSALLEAPICPNLKGPEITFTSEITARSTGELFLYVNDAVIPFSTVFYDNNQGGACVRVERLTPPIP